jgi:hypothetical protein
MFWFFWKFDLSVILSKIWLEVNKELCHLSKTNSVLGKIWLYITSDSQKFNIQLSVWQITKVKSENLPKILEFLKNLSVE